MSQLRYTTSMSLDGFVAGPHQSPQHPLGVRGELLHGWMRELAVWRAQAGLEGGVVNASTEILEREDVNVGAIIMGRNMFGGGPGPWPEVPWNGWWGENPPFHMPVIVLSHFARKPLVCEGEQRSPSPPRGWTRRWRWRENEPRVATSQSPAARVWHVSSSLLVSSMSS